MPPDLFLEWLQTLDRKMHQQYRKILLFADNAPSHPDIDLENGEVKSAENLEGSVGQGQENFVRTRRTLPFGEAVFCQDRGIACRNGHWLCSCVSAVRRIHVAEKKAASLRGSGPRADSRRIPFQGPGKRTRADEEAAKDEDRLACCASGLEAQELQGLKQKLVALGTDGASVMSGRNNGLVALLLEEIPYLLYFHCGAHKLELAALDGMKDDVQMKKVLDMLTDRIGVRAAGCPSPSFVDHGNPSPTHLGSAQTDLDDQINRDLEAVGHTIPTAWVTARNRMTWRNLTNTNDNIMSTMKKRGLTVSKEIANSFHEYLLSELTSLAYQPIDLTLIKASNNKTAWMTSDLFLEWLQTLDRKMHQQYRKVLLFADSAPSHPDIDLENDMASAGMEHRVVQCCCLATLSEVNAVPGNESLPPDLINLSVKLARVSVDGYTCAVGVTAILPELFWDLSREHMEDNNIGKGQMVQACHQKAVDKRQLCFLHPDSDVGEHHKKHGKDEIGRSKKTSVLSILGMDELILEWLKQYGVKMESEHISRKVAAEMLSGFKVEAENLPFSVKGDEASTVKLTASCHFQEYLQKDLVR
ncbi:TIGD4, partial [Branchiostoma lanceolatum]